MMKASSPGSRGTYFFSFYVGAMLAAASCAAVGIFAFGEYEIWTPSVSFLLAILAVGVVTGIGATLFAWPDLLTVRNNYDVSVAWCAVLGAAYGMGLFLITPMLERILDFNSWLFILCQWVYVLGTPPSLRLLLALARGRSSEEGPSAGSNRPNSR